MTKGFVSLSQEEMLSIDGGSVILPSPVLIKAGIKLANKFIKWITR